MEIELVPAAPGDDLDAFVLAAWQSDVVVAHGERISPARLPGFVVEADGRIVGHVSYRIAGMACEVSWHVADPPARGIGSRLLAAVERAAVDAGCQRIWLATTNDRVDALRCYQRRGFRIRAVRPGVVDRARATLKPELPAIGAYGIPMRDEIRLELELGLT